MKKGRAKRLVMQPRFRMKVERDRRKYSRKVKHRKAPDSGGLSFSPDVSPGSGKNRRA